MSIMYRFLAVRENNEPHSPEPTVWLYGDDGYRFRVRWVSGPQINLDPEEWICVMEYKHARYGEECLLTLVTAGWFDTEAEALENIRELPRQIPLTAAVTGTTEPSQTESS